MATAMRLPSATVELIQILGTILRDRVGLSISKTECWTFPKILQKDDSSYEPSNPVATFERAQNEYLIFLGAGHCMVQKPGSGQDRIELRVRCVRNKCLTLDIGDSWDIQLWQQDLDTKSIFRCHHFVCHCYRNELDFGAQRVISAVGLKASKMRVNPPRDIRFS